MDQTPPQKIEDTATPYMIQYLRILLLTKSRIIMSTSNMSIRSFLDARRVAKGSSDWNLTGMGGSDTGSYKVEEE